MEDVGAADVEDSDVGRQRWHVLDGVERQVEELEVDEGLEEGRRQVGRGDVAEVQVLELREVLQDVGVDVLTDRVARQREELQILVDEMDLISGIFNDL